MNEEELLLHFHRMYGDVYLDVSHSCRRFNSRPVVHSWTFWHGGAGESVGPFPTAAELLAAVEAWERSGEREAACEVYKREREAKDRRERLARMRKDEAARVANPSYTPTVEEAARQPDAFVAGMTEERCLGIDPRD